jgi:large subunit ribosomal protein L10
MPRIGIAQDRKRQEPRAEFIRRSEMALNLSQKQEVVAEVAEVAAKAHSLIAAEYAGTTVSQMTAMRKKARETGVYLKVVKNTLASRAVEGTDFAVAKDSTGRSAAVCVLDRGARRCRSPDQGVRQG